MGSALGSRTGTGSAPSAAASSADAFVRSTVAAHPVVVFSKTYCPYCTMAKSALASSAAGVTAGDPLPPPLVVELDKRPDGGAIQAALARLTARRTVPNVFVGGSPVGGGDDVAGLHRSGALKQMLRAAPETLSAANAAAAAATVAAAKGEGAAAPAVAAAGAASPAALKGAASNGVGGGATPPAAGLRTVLFGAGCFWGVELAYARVVGVTQTAVGYAGGTLKSPSYPAVCTGRTGHTEVVRVVHDPAVVSLRSLLDVFEARHDPTVRDRVGNDVGTQYRSAVYVETEEEAAVVRDWAAEVGAARGKAVTTEVRVGVPFWPAEEAHQRYLEKKGQKATKGATTPIRCYG